MGRRAVPDHALRFEPEPDTGGLKPYLHVRRDLWALVTRALFYDLVELGEERDVDGRRMFGVASGGEFFAMAPADELKGSALMDSSERCRSSSAAISSIARARAAHPRRAAGAAPTTRSRISRAAISISIQSLWDQAGVQATRAAAVLVPVVDHAEPGVLLTMRTSDLPSHAGQIAFPGGKIDPGDASPLAAALARGRRGDRARRAR